MKHDISVLSFVAVPGSCRSQEDNLIWFTMVCFSGWLALLLLYVHVAEPLGCYLLADIGIAPLQRSCSLHSAAAKIFQFG